MHYRKIRASRPPLLFELQLNACLARLVAEKSVVLPPPHLMPRMRDYLESLLLAENLPPKAQHIAMLLDSFNQLVRYSTSGKPIVYKKRNSVALLFDVCAVQSEMRLDAPEELVLGYTHTMMGFLLFNTDPGKVAMIGLGGGSMPKYCYRHLPKTSIVVAENDPHVIVLRDHFHVPKDDARFQVLCEDGADFVARTSGEFDVLVVDGFDRAGQPEQLCSQQFYDACHAALAPNGIMVANLLGDVVQTDACLERIHQAFNGAVLVIDALDSLNKIVFACNGNALELPEQVLLGRLRSLECEHVVSLRQTAQSILQQRRLARVA
jgi:spermidine synthase